MSSEALLFKMLQSVTSKIHATGNIDEIMLDLSNEICAVFAADRLTIYVTNEDRSIIVSKVKVGLNNVREIKLPVVPEFSVAGYVALNRKLVNIRDAYDDRELKTFDPPVVFLKEVDNHSGYHTQQLLVSPILDGPDNDVLGVVQIINTRSKKPFTKAHEDAVTELCKTLAIAFKQRTRPRERDIRGKYDYLVRDGVMSNTEFDLATANARQKDIDIEEMLTRDYHVSPARMGESLAKFYGVPYEPFKPDRVRPVELLRNLKHGYAISNGWVPLEETEEGVVVLALDPNRVRRVVPNILGKQKVVYRVCLRQEFRDTVDQLFGEGAAVPGADIDKLILPEGGEAAEEAVEDATNDMSLANDNKVVTLVNAVIVDAYKLGASDIHIEPRPGKGKTRVRFRKDGSLMNYREIPAEYRNPFVARIKIMSQLKPDVKRIPQDGKIKFKQFYPLDIELRVATIPTAGDVEDVVMRILASGKPLKLEEMGFSKHNLAALKDVISKPYGLFFVCGPTGSGKTTTLHSVLGFLNTEDTKIWTAEDPVEITQEGLRQVQINNQQKLTFAASMRAFLRADPDVIMVGEMRDEETVKTGIEASLTGHLVLATLHTNSAPESITRLLDMGMDPLNFADALLGILAQRLAKRLCKDCRQAHVATQDEIRELLNEYCEELKATARWKQNPQAAYKAVYEDWVRTFGNDRGEIVLQSAKGCEKCGGTGYRGRLGLHELLIGGDAVKKDIQERARVSQLFATAINDGMRTLKQDGIEKVVAGLTTMAEVRTVCIK